MSQLGVNVLNYNAILKKGYDNDKALVEASKAIYNYPHKHKRKTKQSNIQVTVQRRRAGKIQGMHMHYYIIIHCFYSSKDETKLRCLVVSYFSCCLYSVSMPLMRNGITGDSNNVICRCKLARWNEIVSDTVRMYVF